MPEYTILKFLELFTFLMKNIIVLSDTLSPLSGVCWKTTNVKAKVTNTLSRQKSQTLKIPQKKKKKEKKT